MNVRFTGFSVLVLLVSFIRSTGNESVSFWTGNHMVPPFKQAAAGIRSMVGRCPSLFSSTMAPSLSCLIQWVHPEMHPVRSPGGWSLQPGVEAHGDFIPIVAESTCLYEEPPPSESCTSVQLGRAAALNAWTSYVGT